MSTNSIKTDLVVNNLIKIIYKKYMVNNVVANYSIII